MTSVCGETAIKMSYVGDVAGNFAEYFLIEGLKVVEKRRFQDRKNVRMSGMKFSHSCQTMTQHGPYVGEEVGVVVDAATGTVSAISTKKERW